jgi:hypothetical protein
MADYYPLLQRALEGLSDTAPEKRREVYDRARSALTTQLRSLDPPLAEADITRESLALNEAIDRLEREWAPRDPPTPRMPAASSGRMGAPPRAPEPDPPPIERNAPRERPRVETVAPSVADSGRGRSVILGTVLVLVVASIAIAAWYLRDRPADLPGPTAATETPRPESEGKLGDRVAGGERLPGGERGGPSSSGSLIGQPASSVQSRDVAVAQRAVLYEENPADAQAPKTSAGRALWRLDAVNAGQGQPLETVVRVTIEVPDSGLTLALTIRRNADATLPASHTVELAFTTSGDANRSVRDVGLLQFKNDETVRGTPVAGLPVPVKDNLFLIGLSNLRSDIERNTDLILHRNWVDLPIRFASGGRAILSFEKGVSGEQILNDAFRQWQ